MKYITSMALALLLAGCGGTLPAQIVIKEVPRVVIPADEMYNCPVITSLPNPATLTDLEVAQLIVMLKKDISICKNSMDDIKLYLEDAKKRIESSK